MKIYKVVFFFILLGCSSKNDLMESVISEHKIPAIHQNLIGFKATFLAELGDEKYQSLEKKVNRNKLDTRYIDDIIYVSYYEELNACGRYEGNLEVKQDSIILKLDLVSDEVCTSLAIMKIAFIIDNPDKKKKIIKKLR